MEFYFNELSIKAARLEYENIDKLIGIARESYKTGIRTCRISPEDSGRLFERVRKCNNRDYINLFLGYFKHPYESETVENIQDEYLEHEWKCGDENCYGLALSYLNDSVSVSFFEIEKWRNYKINITKNGEFVEVKNISDEDSFKRYESFFEYSEQVELIETLLQPDKKKIKLRDDHGSDKLKEFADKVVRSPYVVEIVNSEKFSPNNRRFIKKIFRDGKIHVVLPWTDQGLGVIIQTTGRNYRETQEIAKVLEERYGK